MVKPVLLGYEVDKEINSIIEATLATQQAILTVSLQECHEVHTFYEAKEVEKLVSLFEKKIDQCFIADGHHRFEALKLIKNDKKVKGGDYHGLLCCYFSFEQLKICGYHRAITLKDISFDEVLSCIQKFGSINKISSFQSPGKKHELVIVYDKNYYIFEWNKDLIDDRDEITFDVDLFNQYVMKGIFDESNHRSDGLVTYIEGNLSAQSVLEKTDKDGLCLFIFHPIDKEDLEEASRIGRILPPKSTWFLPRIRSGIINAYI